MAFIKLEFKSEILNCETSVNLILPDKRIEGKPLPTVYLLHGFTGSENSWCRQTSIARYVRYKNVAVVMPNAFNSFYTDMTDGVYCCYSYILKELMPFCIDNFNLSPHREDTYIAGLSMGGYGAFKFALANPSIFTAAASFSGALDIERISNEKDMTMVFSKPVKNSKNDLFYLAENIGDVRPRLYQWCGTEDFLYADNIKFRDFIKDKGFEYTYKESPGDHEWKYWDEQVRRIFSWFGIANNPKLERN